MFNYSIFLDMGLLLDIFAALPSLLPKSGPIQHLMAEIPGENATNVIRS